MTVWFRRPAKIVGALGIAIALALYSVHQVHASDHQDSPLTVSRPGIDITDVFVYPSPTNPQNVVLAMDVWPLIPTGMGTTKYFDPGAMYQFKIGTGEHYSADYVIQFKADGSDANQKISFYGPSKPNVQGVHSTFVGKTGEAPYNVPTTLSNGIKFFAGPREDPFYFDLPQFYALLPDRNFANQPSAPASIAGCFRNPGNDFLAGFNVLQLTVELPRRMLAQTGGHVGRINVWATTSLPDDDPNAAPSGPQNVLADVVKNVNSILTGTATDTQTYVQVERLARPAVKEVTENYANHDITNRSAITDDVVLAQSIHTFATQVAGRSNGIADALDRLLIPDAIEADLSAPGPARYLAVETNGKSGLPVAVVRLVPTIGIYGIKRALGDPYRQFGGRDLRSPVVDLSLGAIFGSLVPKLGLAREDGHETPCLTSDHTTPAAKHIIASFPYAGVPR
jgi:Domain of unknown function (DUF4331)